MRCVNINVLIVSAFRIKLVALMIMFIRAVVMLKIIKAEVYMIAMLIIKISIVIVTAVIRLREVIWLTMSFSIRKVVLIRAAVRLFHGEQEVGVKTTTPTVSIIMLEITESLISALSLLTIPIKGIVASLTGGDKLVMCVVE